MRSREPYVARASEDERKERLHWFHTTIWMLLWQVASFTLWQFWQFWIWYSGVKLFFAGNRIFICKMPWVVLRWRSLFRAGLKKEITISRQWLTFVVCASVRLRRFMGIFPWKARPANYPKTHSQRHHTSVRKIFLIRPVEMAKKEILSNQFSTSLSLQHCKVTHFHLVYVPKMCHQSEKRRACHRINSKRTEPITPFIWMWPARRKPRPGQGKCRERREVQKNV